MSAQTMAKLEDAIREHLADEGQGGITTAWVLVSNSTDGGEHDEGRNMNTHWIAFMKSESAKPEQRNGSQTRVECPHWEPGRITPRADCTACEAAKDQQNRSE